MGRWNKKEIERNVEKKESKEFLMSMQICQVQPKTMKVQRGKSKQIFLWAAWNSLNSTSHCRDFGLSATRNELKSN